MTTIRINPPPKNMQCECCGKHINDIKPFGKAGDPLVGDFEGAKLLKTFRSMLPESCLENSLVGDTVTSSWECRDCIVLNSENYFKIKNAILNQTQNKPSVKS